MYWYHYHFDINQSYTIKLHPFYINYVYILYLHFTLSLNHLQETDGYKAQ